MSHPFKYALTFWYNQHQDTETSPHFNHWLLTLSSLLSSFHPFMLHCLYSSKSHETHRHICLKHTKTHTHTQSPESEDPDSAFNKCHSRATHTNSHSWSLGEISDGVCVGVSYLCGPYCHASRTWSSWVPCCSTPAKRKLHTAMRNFFWRLVTECEHFGECSCIKMKKQTYKTRFF